MIQRLLGLYDVEFSSVGSEYFINSQELEDKVRTLLPSQGGAGAGFDLSASTQIIPIIDLTESAEGSNIRQDLQSSLSFSTVTSFNVSAATSTLINNTGYFRVFGTATVLTNSAQENVSFTLNDGTSNKVIWQIQTEASGVQASNATPFDFIVYLTAGDSLIATSSTNSNTIGSTRQIADVSGTLTNP